MEEAFRFDRVTKIYQSRQVALADVSFRVPVGATVGLLGANGSGKSTAIRIALGLITPSAGEITVMGQRMRLSVKTARQRMGYLSDDPAFPSDMTAISYLQFVGKCFQLERRDREARLGTLLRAVGLTDDAGRKIGSYSTGMRTRLGIVASLMNDPELLVWDEPTAGLDPISRRQTLELLERFRGTKTVVLSSHILGDIDRVCDRLLILNHGQLLFDGTRSALESAHADRALELRLTGNIRPFLSALRERFNLLSEEGDKIRIELNGQHEGLRPVITHLFSLAEANQVRIEGINSTNRQLEDAYLKLISDDEFRGFLRATAT